MKLNSIAKAVFAGAIAALGGLEVASVDNHFTAAELIRTAIIGLGAFAATYWVPNAPADPAPAPAPSLPAEPAPALTRGEHGRFVPRG